MCDKYILHILKMDITRFGKQLLKTLKFLEIYVCDFKKVFNLNHVYNMLSFIESE